MGRGEPREQYHRAYILVEPSANASQVSKIAEWVFDYWRPTIGASADDAGIGDLDIRRVMVMPGEWGGNLAAFFAQYYPGIDYRPIEGDNDYQLRGRLWSAFLIDRLLLGYPTTNDQYRITSPFGVWRPDKGIHHNGVDLASAPVWNDQVVASIAGQVIHAGVVTGQESFGVQVRTATTDGDMQVLCRYAHMVDGSLLVGVGDQVVAGQVLGVPDSTGNSTGHHLHFDVKIEIDSMGISMYIDPAPLIPELNGISIDPPGGEDINRVGVHWIPVTYPPPVADWAWWIRELLALGVGTVKLLHAGEPRMVAFGDELVRAGMRVIVRLYQSSQFPVRIDQGIMEMVNDWVRIGVEHFEIGNEPNLSGEWRAEWADSMTWQDTALVATIAANWWLDAEEVIRRGGKPAIYAMAPTDRGPYRPHPRYSSVEWLRGIMREIAQNHRAEMVEHIENDRVWHAVHVSPFSRPLDFDPGATRPDDMCLRAWEVYHEIVRGYFGVNPVMISTEGGVYSPEHMVALGWDSYTEAEYADRTVGMFDRLDRDGGPPVCTWIMSDEGVHDQRWIDNGWYRGKSPRGVVTAMKIRAARE